MALNGTVSIYSNINLKMGECSDDIDISKKQSVLGFQRLTKFFENHEFCDVTLIAGIGRIRYENFRPRNFPSPSNDFFRIPAHRVVLAASSSYFALMFASDLRESFENEIEMRELRSDILEPLIRFCYTGRIHLNETNVKLVLETAAYLQIMPALDECSQFIESRTNHRNCMGINALAEQHQLKKLLATSNKCFCEHFEKIMNVDEFKEMDCEQLARLLQNNGLEVDKEEHVFLAAVTWVIHNEKDRAERFPELMQHVRLTLLDPSVSPEFEMLCNNLQFNITP